jgi:hypothetical protein
MPAGGNNSMPCTTRSATPGGRSQAERKELKQMREPDVINDEVMRVLQADIDPEETLIVGATRHEPNAFAAQATPRR